MKYYSFADVLLKPKFSHISSRKDVSTVSGYLNTPIISSNMDTVTGPAMTWAMDKAGGVGCLHRFWSIEDNIKAFKESHKNAWVSVGISDYEIERGVALYDHGATTIVIDVANGGNMSVVNATKKLLEACPNADIVVGNFASGDVISDFYSYAKVAAFKVGIGGGSACSTRVVTGCGMPTLASVFSSAKLGHNIIADGGISSPGDFAKALAAGATAIMAGRMFAGTDESPGSIVNQLGHAVGPGDKWYKKYRGSASYESYEVQGKISEWRTAEGISTTVPYTGSVAKVMQEYDAGLRSAMSYCNAATLKEFRQNAEFIEITSAGYAEGLPKK